MPSRSRNVVLIIAAVLAVLVGAGYGVGYSIRWRHEQSIESRLATQREIIWKHAERTGLPSELIKSVVRAESGGDPRAVSPKGARGLMQIMPDAERDALRLLREDPDKPGDLFDPEYNIRIGTTYLKHLHDRFNGDLHLVMAAYHMGPTRVARVLAKHPQLTGRELVAQHANPTTRAYVWQVVGK